MVCWKTGGWTERLSVVKMRVDGAGLRSCPTAGVVIKRVGPAGLATRVSLTFVRNIISLFSLNHLSPWLH